jgi:hypothetical protein
MLTLEWSNSRVVAYRDFRYDPPWEIADGPVGRFPHDAVRSLRRSEYLERRERLLELYDALFESLAGADPGAGAWEGEFAQLFALLLEPGLEPYYRQLSPRFTARFLDGSRAF